MLLYGGPNVVTRGDCLCTPNLHSGMLVKTSLPAATCSWAQLCLGPAWVNPSTEPYRRLLQQERTECPPCLPDPVSQSLWGTKTTHGGGLSDPSSISLRPAQDSTRERDCFCLHFESLSGCKYNLACIIVVRYEVALFGWSFSWTLRDQQGTSPA